MPSTEPRPITDPRPGSSTGARVERLVGIYDADGTWSGEVAYVVGKLLGRRSCALCDITHGVREKQSWRACRAALPVPFDTIHRDERDAELVAHTPELPAVVAESDAGAIVLLGPEELAACGKDPEALVLAIDAAVQARGLDLGA